MRQKDIITIIIPIVIFIIVWVLFNIYHNAATSTISESLNINIQPITPDFNIRALSEVKKRERIEPLYQMDRVEPLTPTQSPLPSPTISLPTIETALTIIPTETPEEAIEPTITP